MYIISKYKDYYDYLTGIYGIDKKLVLDRRDSESLYMPSIDTKIVLYIAGYIVEGWCTNDKLYFGKDLYKFKNKHQSYLPSRHWKRDYNKSIYIGEGMSASWIYTEAVKDKDNINIKENCPILYSYWNKYKKYPQLSKFNLASFIPPETIYKWIEEWLSARITDKETHIDTRDDVSKLQDKGFDKKYSFRPKIKK